MHTEVSIKTGAGSVIGLQVLYKDIEPTPMLLLLRELFLCWVEKPSGTLLVGDMCYRPPSGKQIEGHTDASSDNSEECTELGT